jgi:hypothetical protein
MSNDAQLDVLFNASLMILIIGVSAFLFWQVGPFLLFLLGASSKARTFEDWLAVALLIALIVWLSGDSLTLLATMLLNLEVGRGLSAIWLHLVPQAIFITVFFVRIITLAYPTLVKRTSSLWKPRTEPFPAWLFVTAAALNAGDYALRSLGITFFPWVTEPFKGFWATCSVLAALTWLMAGIAYWMAASIRAR